MISARSNGIGPKVEDLRQPQARERFRPDAQCALAALLEEDDLPILEAQSDEIAVIGEVKEAAARTAVLVAGEVGQEIEAVDVDLVFGFSVRPGFMSLLQLVDDVGFAGGGKQRGQPVVVLDDLVRDRPWRESCVAIE